jgi:DNA-damage-inducible protein D
MPSKKQSGVAVDNGSLISRLLIAFEQAKRIDEHGKEYWLAREYMAILGYANWRTFNTLIDRAKATLEAEGGSVSDHFAASHKMIDLGKGAKRETPDYRLTRRASYLVSINGDPAQKASIAAAQRYFVEQARKQEITEMLGLAGSDAERVEARRKLAATEEELKEVASDRLTRPEEHLRQIRDAGHEALLSKPVKKIRADLGVPEERDVMDFADPLIVKGSDFATALTARQVATDESLKGVGKIKGINAGNHKGVRDVMTGTGMIPGQLPGAGDIRAVQARLERQRAKLLKQNAEGQS